MIANMLTAENLTAILTKGEINAGDASVTMYQLTELDTSDLLETLKRISPTKLGEFAIRYGDSEISLHFEGIGWKLSGIRLPAHAAQVLANSLVNSRRGNG